MKKNSLTLTFTSRSNPEDSVSSHVFIVELIEASRSEDLINDRATIRHLINNSPLGPKSLGGIRFLPSAHKIVLHIINNEDIEGLLKLDKLSN